MVASEVPTNWMEKALRWSTPIEGYQQLDGLRLPTRGSAIHAYRGGPFTYGKFKLKSVAYNAQAP